jgi:hypothetical protein
VSSNVNGVSNWGNAVFCSFSVSGTCGMARAATTSYAGTIQQAGDALTISPYPYYPFATRCILPGAPRWRIWGYPQSTVSSQPALYRI